MRNTPYRVSRRKNKGSVLAFAVVIAMILVLVGMALLSLGAQSRIESTKTIHELNARCAADAGLARALVILNNSLISKTWNSSLLPTVTNEKLPVTDALYSVQSEFTDGQYLIESTGISHNNTRTVRAKLRLKGLFELALNCKNNIILKAGTLIDSVDSRISLNPADTDVPAIIGTNSTASSSIVLNNGVVVDGDVVAGYGGVLNTVIKDLGATVDNQYVATNVVDFPAVTPPPYTAPNSPITINGGVKTMGNGGDYAPFGKYTSIQIKQFGKLRITSPSVIYVTGNIDMGNGCEIIIDNNNNASLTLYINGNFLADNSAGINNMTSDPKRFALYGTSTTTQTLNLKAKSDAFGVVYAPNATLTIYSNGNVYGSFVAKDFEQKNAANFYYDAAFREVNPFDEGSRFIIERWIEE